MKYNKSKELQNLNLMPITEVGKILGLSHPSVLNLIDKGSLIAIKVGGLWRVNESDLLDFIKRNTTGNGIISNKGHAIQI